MKKHWKVSFPFGRTEDKALVPYYIAEIYTQLKNYDKAQIVAQNYPSAYPNNERCRKMYRILGEMPYYHFRTISLSRRSISAITWIRIAGSPAGMSLLHAGTLLLPNKKYTPKQPKHWVKWQLTTMLLPKNAYLHMGSLLPATGRENSTHVLNKQPPPMLIP